jgi:16S rRNA (adenine1518-N6/adenine1519-N6)-dimethyltransferase
MDTGRVLREAGLRPRKGLGQHFLVDASVPPRIADAAEIAPGDTVVEVGPGLGVLTAALAARLDPAAGGRLVAVELDTSLAPVLRERMAPFPAFHLVAGDVLALAPADLLAAGPDSATAAALPPYKVAANLPYYITSAVLRHFLEAVPPPTRLVVMVQREVAERIVARPPAMSLLAVSVQFYGAARIMFRVPPGAFHPPPKVDSAVLRIDVYPPAVRPVTVADRDHFFAVARAGFGQRRKQLGNSLATGLGRDKGTIAALLSAAGVDPTRRPETLTLAEWAAVADALTPERG